MSAKLNVLILRIARGCWERCEVGTWLADCFCQHGMGRTKTQTLMHGVIDGEPTPAARNSAVVAAKQARADVLVMVDNDMDPSPTFFAHAIEFLASRKGSVCIGSPYCGAAPERLVQATRINDLVRFYREDAAEMNGDKLVSCIGTGLIACRMQCFDTLEAPWFDYEYTDALRHTVKTTEDFYFTRRLSEAGGRVYAAWDHWSGHAKTEVIQKPTPAGTGSEQTRGEHAKR